MKPIKQRRGWRSPLLLVERAIAASRAVVGPYERILWSNPSMTLGSFDASPDHEDFETAGAIGDRPAIAFSRSAVGIAQAKRDAFVSDGTVAVLHNPRLSVPPLPRGSPRRSLRVAVGRPGAAALASTRGSGAIRGGRSRRRTSRSPAAPPRSCGSSRGTCASRPPDELWVEETLLEILGLLVTGGRRRGGRGRRRGTTRLARALRELCRAGRTQPWTVDVDREGRRRARRFTRAASSAAARGTRCTAT